MRPIVLLLAVVLGVSAAGCQGHSVSMTDLIEKITGPSTADQVVAVESTSADQRREALEEIVKDKNARQVESVTKLYCLVARTDPNPMVRATAVRGLASLEGDGVIPTLCDVIETDKDPYVRTDAAHALGSHDDAAAIEALIGALQDDADTDVAVAAADSLRNLQSTRATAALAEAVEDRNLAVAYTAWESLRYMTGQDLPRQREPWTAFLASAEDPFARYGRAPKLPGGESQRPHFRQGVTDFVQSLFEKDPLEAELE